MRKVSLTSACLETCNCLSSNTENSSTVFTDGFVPGQLPWYILGDTCVGVGGVGNVDVCTNVGTDVGADIGGDVESGTGFGPGVGADMDTDVDGIDVLISTALFESLNGSDIVSLTRQCTYLQIAHFLLLGRLT